MNSRSTRLLVLGLGNVLLSDDGVGPAAIALLQTGHQPPDGVLVLDGGTLGLTLLSYIEDAATVVLVDAIKADAPVGTLVRLDGDEVGPAVATRLSPHQVGVADLLEGARWRGRQPQRIVLLGIVPDRFELGVGLSPAVGAAIPNLVQQVLDEARAIGCPFINQAEEPAGPLLDVARLALGAAQ